MIPRDPTRTVYLFGALGRAPYGYMTFAPGGRVTTYDNPAEYKWEHRDGRLVLRSADRRVTSTLRQDPATGVFVPDDVGQHTLSPVLGLGAAPDAARDLPPVLVNTVAKAGTYLVAEALTRAGYRSTDLHLSARFLHDNRGRDPQTIHWDPDAHRVPCDAAAAAALLRPGEFAVAHIDELEQLARIAALKPLTGLRMLNVVRHPASQMVSMYHFKRTRVKPRPRDTVWQAMPPGMDRFRAFAMTHPIDYWLRVSTQITDNFPYLRFEDLRAGRVTPGGADRDLSRLLSRGLTEAIGAQTSTYSGDTGAEERIDLEDPVLRAWLEAEGVYAYADPIWPERAG